MGTIEGGDQREVSKKLRFANSVGGFQRFFTGWRPPKLILLTRRALTLEAFLHLTKRIIDKVRHSLKVFLLTETF